MSSDKPLVTFALLAYNQQKYIREAVEGAFAQDYPNLEIILSDDCSTDRTFEIVKEMVATYDGCHKIVLNRNECNLGLANHFNNIVSWASGEIIAVAAGDDISLYSRVSDAVAALSTDEKLMFVSFVDTIIDSDGEIMHPPGREYKRPVNISLQAYIAGCNVPISGASRVFRKSVFEFFGNISGECPTADTVMLMRCLLKGNGVVLPTAGIRYRKHGNNLSGASRIHRMNFTEIRAQYLIDVEAFLEKGGPLDFERQRAAGLVREWAKRNFERRALLAKLHFSSGLGLRIVLSLLLNSNFTVREKLGLIAKHYLAYTRPKQ